MNNKTKYILYGIGTFVLVAAILCVGRPLIKNYPIADGFKDPVNWLIAVASSVVSAVSGYSKAQAKQKNNKQ